MTDTNPAKDGVQWTSNPVLGDAGVNYFWAVTAVSGSVESDPSGKYGEFDYHLITTDKTNYNKIALPLVDPGINKASDLTNIIPNSNSIARWDAGQQGYIQYVPIFPDINDFEVHVGNPYFVHVTGESVFTLFGEITDPVFNLVTTATTSYNDIMLPLQKGSITSAAGLAADIPNCNSVASWDAVNQGYLQYVKDVPSINFETRAGYSYLVHVTDNTSWPSGGLLKSGAPEMAAPDVFAKIPHAVFGQLLLNEPGFGFRASIESRPDEKLTEQSPGCMVSDNKFLIQVSSLAGGWRIGDKLNIEFYDRAGNTIGQTGIVLSPDAYDVVDENEISVNNLPVEYQLSQNYPNPFNPETTIRYTLPEDGYVKMTISDITGRTVKNIVSGYKKAGSHHVIWDSSDESGNMVASGEYFCKLEFKNNTKLIKLLLLR